MHIITTDFEHLTVSRGLTFTIIRSHKAESQHITNCDEQGESQKCGTEIHAAKKGEKIIGICVMKYNLKLQIRKIFCSKGKCKLIPGGTLFLKGGYKNIFIKI